MIPEESLSMEGISANQEGQPPASYPNDWVEQVDLRDGTLVTIRPIRPDDARGLQESFARLSPQSIYMRFLETFKMLSDEQARFFANVDYHERMALVAEIQEGDRQNLIGVARYALVEPGLAESAIVVVDEYQRRGLGSLLMDRLVKYARQHGVRTFSATVHQTNASILNFIGRGGLPVERKLLEPGVWSLRVELQPRK